MVHKFREGGYNTLVATCVGEEGLDIGDVDLIICFDAHNSPVRYVPSVCVCCVCVVLHVAYVLVAFYVYTYKNLLYNLNVDRLKLVW